MWTINRFFTRPRPTTVETMNKCFQGRYLLRAGPTFNARFIGVVAKAQELYGVTLHGFVAMSSHWHAYATYDDPKQMALFHCYLGTHVSKEAGKVHDWSETVFPRPYHHVELSEEFEAQRERLKYLLSQGCKEGLVASPLDWPGPSSTWSLVSGEPLVGEWIDRTALTKARERGEEVTEDDFVERLEVKLSPVSSMAHLSPEEYRRFILEIVREIEDETAVMHKVAGTSPRGAEWVLAQDPHYRPTKSAEKRPRPWFHAYSPEEKRRMRDAMVVIVALYREAAERLKAGCSDVEFPLHTFPPASPFVTAASLASLRKRVPPSREVERLEPG